MPKSSLFCVVFVGKYIPLVIASIMLASIFPGFLKASLRKYVPKCNFVSTFFFFLVHLSIMKEGRHPTNCLLSKLFIILLVFSRRLCGWHLTIYLVWTHFPKCHLHFWVKCIIHVVILCGPSLILRVIWGVGWGGADEPFRALPAKWDHLHGTSKKEC